MSTLRNLAYKNQKTHALRRAFERYGIVINSEMYDKLNHIVRNGSFLLLRKKSLTRRMYYLKYNEQEFVIGWDKNKKQISTFLPIDMIMRDLIERKQEQHRLLKQRQERNK